MDFLIAIGIITFMYLLGKYAIEEGERVERQKKFMKDLEEFDNKNYKSKTKEAYQDKMGDKSLSLVIKKLSTWM